MNEHEVVEKMESLGFRHYGDMDRYNEGYDLLFGMRCETGPECDYNHRSPEVLAHIYMSRRNVEFEICGEASGVWVKPLIYSIRYEDIEKELPRIVRALTAMWDVAYKELSR